MAPSELLEISDLIVDFDIKSLARRPVHQAEVIEKFQRIRDRRGAQIVASMPATGGVIDPDYVDRLLVRVHGEMQRLSEEFQHGQRVFELLVPLLDTFAEQGVQPPYRIVDIGCGTGYVIRWLAARGVFEHEVELMGADFNGALIQEANRLKEVEKLQCRFQVVDAFTMAEPAVVYLSTGVLHHFRGDGLTQFLLQHDQPQTRAFVHFDFQPSPMARPGAWLFHYLRMREPLARHDGVVSARRVHSADTLLSAAGKSSFATAMYNTHFWKLPIPRAFHTLLGIRHESVDAFRRFLGRRVGRLGTVQ